MPDRFRWINRLLEVVRGGRRSARTTGAVPPPIATAGDGPSPAESAATPQPIAPPLVSASCEMPWNDPPLTQVIPDSASRRRLYLQVRRQYPRVSSLGCIEIVCDQLERDRR